MISSVSRIIVFAAAWVLFLVAPALRFFKSFEENVGECVTLTSLIGRTF